jgi:hypothetical protein
MACAPDALQTEKRIRVSVSGPRQPRRGSGGSYRLRLSNLAMASAVAKADQPN